MFVIPKVTEIVLKESDVSFSTLKKVSDSISLFSGVSVVKSEKECRIIFDNQSIKNALDISECLVSQIRSISHVEFGTNKGIDLSISKKEVVFSKQHLKIPLYEFNTKVLSLDIETLALGSGIDTIIILRTILDSDKNQNLSEVLRTSITGITGIF